jgi:TRAP-type C4-dicarboxylate transport system substrate-binding protein
VRNLWLVGALLLGGPARADVVLRMGTVVPDGTAWARELKAFAREVEDNAHQKMKFYWGGIAGDEHAMLQRIKRGQLDGAAGAAVCADVAPSLKVTRIQGLFPNRDAAERLVHQVPNLDEEARKAGFVWLGVGGLGPSVVFSRNRISTWEELAAARLWRWDLDPVAFKQDQAMGLHVVPMPVETAAEAFDQGKLDGFVALAASALAFQWHSRAPHILPLEFDYLNACIIISVQSFEALPIETQKVIRAAGAKLQHRMELVGREMDRPVMSGALVGKGIHAWPVAPALHDRFYKAAHETTKNAAAEGVPHEALEWVQKNLGHN